MGPRKTGRFTLRATLATIAALALGADRAAAEDPAPKPSPAGAEVLARTRDNERALLAFAALTPAERKDFSEYLALEVGHLGTFQGSLVHFAHRLADRAPDKWPVRAAPEAFDSKTHTPENDIPRHWLDSAAPRVQRAVAKFLEPTLRERLDSAFEYDYATRSIVRRSDWNDGDRTVRNAVHGCMPGLDLAEALIERALDDGSMQTAAFAFGHAYTDRNGGAFPGVTLYDAYSSGEEIEMPDVDTLGILHVVWGDWTSWRAPIPERRQEPLYEKLSALYLDLHHHIGLRRALARAYLTGSAEMRDNYAGVLDNLHALWEKHESTPEKLAATLPKPADWGAYLAAWTKVCHEQGEIYQAGLTRRATLDREAGFVRAAVLAALEEFGAFKRLDTQGVATPPPK